MEGREQDLIDLSLKGMCVRRTSTLPVGRELPFYLKLPAGGKVQGTAKVRWCEEYGRLRTHGLEIVKVRPFQTRSLFKYLNPRYFGVVEALDLTLEFAFSAIALLVLAQFVQNPGAMARITDFLPWLGIAGGLGVSAYFLVSS